MKQNKQKYFFEWVFDLSRLLYPRICSSCGYSLSTQEDILCVGCIYKLPRTNFHRLKDNPVSRKFEGRIPINGAFSFLFFQKGNAAQILLHELKYNGRQDIGERLGAMYGRNLVEDGIALPGIIIPLPLHPAKEKIRGFNQCDPIARGLQKYLGCPIGRDVVVRRVANASQTRKGRFERWINVEHIFEVVKPEQILDKEVLLIDDVVTTGSTLEACGRKILDAGAAGLTMATIASA